MKLLFLANTDYPNTHAHTVQMTRFAHALREHFDVHMFFAKLNAQGPALHRAAQDRYGLSLEGVSFHETGRGSMTGVRFFKVLWNILRDHPEEGFFYTRKFGLAGKIAWTRRLHGHKVFLESHKKDGFFNQEQLPQSPYAELRRSRENEKRSVAQMSRTYASVDGIVFTTEPSRQVIAQHHPGVHATAEWFPLHPRGYTAEGRHGIVHVGSLGRTKLTHIIVDALARAGDGVRIDFYGGTDTSRAEFQELLERAGVAHRADLKGRVPHAMLHAILSRYRFGLAVTEGIKMVDYVECGLIPIVPEINVYRWLFRPDQAVFFAADDAAALARALDDATNGAGARKPSRELLERYTSEAFGQRMRDFFQAGLRGSR